MQFLNRLSSSLTAFNLPKVSTIAILLLVGWGFSLTLYTIQLQHSCYPMLEWSNIVKRPCPSEIATAIDNQTRPLNQPSPQNKPSHPEKTLTTIPPVEKELSQQAIGSGDSSLFPKFPTPIGEINSKDVVAVATGLAIVGVLAVIGMPVLAAVATGTLVGLTARVVEQAFK